MKNMKYILLIAFASVFMISSCTDDDFLERYPLDAMSDATYFSQTSDLESYMNGMYGGIIRKQAGNKWTKLENGSDNLVTSNPASILMRQSVSGVAPVKDDNWNDRYDYIRKVNYFIQNAYKVSRSTAAQHYIGEGYFARAWVYFNLLKKYGGVPYIDKVLNVDSEELYRTRDQRNIVAEKIIQDLDSAIENLSYKGIGEAVAGRINKEAALVLKTRVGLFEGSWEYYHDKKSTKFKVSGSDGTEFLKAAVDAGQKLINYQGNKIFIGSSQKEYQDYFNQMDYSTINGAFLYKAYSQSLGIVQLWYRASAEGCDCGLTKSCIDAYLMKDGKPSGVSSIVNDDTKMDALVSNKDPRLGQTIYNPAKGQFSNFWDYLHAYNSSYPGLIITQQRQPSYSGYRVWKGIVFASSELDNGETDDLIVRYEEALLNFAEAKAILGTITQADLDKSVNVIRSRVNMPAMDLGIVNSWAYTYTKKDGYDPTAPNVLNEIRRERRVELVLEGFRYDDLRRWALLEDVFNGRKPVGAHLQEFMDYWNNGKNLISEGFEFSDTTSVKLVIGTNVDTINGYINPFFKNADFKATSGMGYYIDPERDYLNPIPTEEITLYKDKGGVSLEQNPGWF